MQGAHIIAPERSLPWPLVRFAYAQELLHIRSSHPSPGEISQTDYGNQVCRPVRHCQYLTRIDRFIAFEAPGSCRYRAESESRLRSIHSQF